MSFLSTEENNNTPLAETDIDFDKNGAIDPWEQVAFANGLDTEEELDQYIQLFGNRNGDGKLSYYEFNSNLDLADLNGNGKIDDDEIQSVFDAVDTNGNKQIDDSEFEFISSIVIDENGDSKISEEERSKYKAKSGIE